MFSKPEFCFLCELLTALVADHHIFPSFVTRAWILTMVAQDGQLVGRTPSKRQARRLRVLLDRKDLSLLGFAGEEPILNGVVRRPKIDVGHKRRFVAAPPLHDCCRELPRGTD